MTQKYKPTEIKIPDVCKRYPPLEEQLTQEGTMCNPLVKIEWNKGIFQYLEGAEYPMKSFTDESATWALNYVKRNFVQSLKLFSKWYFYPAYLLIAVLPWKAKKKAMEAFLTFFCDSNHKFISPIILKTEYLTPMAQEIEWAVYTFLSNLGVSPHLCSQFSEIFSTMLEYDNAYRYRVQDIFSETTKSQLLASPIKEIKRLLEIYTVRQGGYLGGKNDMVNKFRYVAMGLRVILLHPKIKKVFKISLSEIDVRKLGFDEADRYWVCIRSNEYLFLGKTKEERLELIKGKSLPVEVVFKRNKK
jgi:hypothetical protein